MSRQSPAQVFQNSGAAVAFLQEVNPQPHPQRQVFALGKHGINAIGRCGIVFQHRHQLARSDLGLHLPGAAPGNAITRQAPVVQHLAVGAVQRARGLQVGHFAIRRA